MSEKLSIVVPIFNESTGLNTFYEELTAVLAKSDVDSYQIIFCNDGSTDDTVNVVKKIAAKDNHVLLVSLSRNFGKEAALTAGISEATGEAIICIDGDGQHPVELIPEFINSWRNGAKVVIGIRNKAKDDPRTKRFASRMFYAIFNRLSSQKLVPASTDFRLIDKSVQKAFLRLDETERITRGLIDWVGFKRDYIHFNVKSRSSGKAGYSSPKLLKLASNSIVSLSPIPLYLSGGLGVIITPLALLLGLTVIIEQLLLEDPLNWDFSGTAMLGILIVFLVGIMLISLGILSLYISHIHNLSKHRPLYIVDEEQSIGANTQKTK